MAQNPEIGERIFDYVVKRQGDVSAWVELDLAVLDIRTADDLVQGLSNISGVHRWAEVELAGADLRSVLLQTSSTDSIPGIPAYTPALEYM